MPQLGPEMILRELLSWMTLLVIIGGGLAALVYLRLSAWMFLVAAGFGGLAFQSLLTRFVILFAAHLNQGQNMQAVFFVSSLVGMLSWIALVAGLFAVFRDIAERLRFHEEREQVRAGSLGGR